MKPAENNPVENILKPDMLEPGLRCRSFYLMERRFRELEAPQMIPQRSILPMLRRMENLNALRHLEDKAVRIGRSLLKLREDDFRCLTETVVKLQQLRKS